MRRDVVFGAVTAQVVVVVLLVVLFSACSDSPAAPTAGTTAGTVQTLQKSDPPGSSWCSVRRCPTPSAAAVTAADVTVGDDLFLSSVGLSPSQYQTMIIRTVDRSPADVTIELGDTPGHGWAGERRIRLVLPLDYPIVVRHR